MRGLDQRRERKTANGGGRTEIAFTSPPYNVGNSSTLASKYQFNGSKYVGDRDNRTEEEYVRFLEAFTVISLEYTDYSFVNVQSITGNKTALIEFLHRMKKRYADTMIWYKGHSAPAMAENVLNSCYEYIHVFSHKGTRTVGTKKFRGTIRNVIEIGAQRNNEYLEFHNATFPLDLPVFILSNFCNESVLDLFGGTGTTLIAAEQLDRTCYMMELDPRYVDIIIDRWEKFTGKKAVKVE